MEKVAKLSIWIVLIFLFALVLHGCGPTPEEIAASRNNTQILMCTKHHGSPVLVDGKFNGCDYRLTIRRQRL